MDKDKVIKTLQKAKKKVEKGWIKGKALKHRLFRPNEYCALGAIMASACDFKVEHDCITALIESLPRGHYSIPEFNDSGNTKKQDVLDLFQRAIEKVNSTVESN